MSGLWSRIVKSSYTAGPLSLAELDLEGGHFGLTGGFAARGRGRLAATPPPLHTVALLFIIIILYLFYFIILERQQQEFLISFVCTYSHINVVLQSPLKKRKYMHKLYFCCIRAFGTFGSLQLVLSQWQQG